MDLLSADESSLDLVMSGAGRACFVPQNNNAEQCENLQLIQVGDCGATYKITYYFNERYNYTVEDPDLNSKVAYQSLMAFSMVPMSVWNSPDLILEPFDESIQVQLPNFYDAQQAGRRRLQQDEP